ncbi:MAG: hybrid sensor histidine kinase/response regulator [Rhodospirillales bacterium]|nr:MAG: hybrid sensor histidine kinase/response regulator [Rhodospirillales bacterium]
MDDLMRDFLAETTESLSILDLELVKFEKTPDDADILMNIFRLVHTIKGTCGFLGLSRLERVAHAGEDVLGRFRDGALQPNAAAVSLILACIDRIREIIAALEDTGSEPAGSDEVLIEQLRALAAGDAVIPAAAPSAEPAVATPAPQAEHLEAAPTEGGGAAAPLMAEAGYPMAAEMVAEVEAALAAGQKAASEAEILADCRSEAETADMERPDDYGVAAAEETAASAAAAYTGLDRRTGSDRRSGDDRRDTAASAQSIRVSVDVLETLMTMVSELVLTRNNLLQMVRGRDDSEFAEPLQRLSLITTDLQEGVMKTRMQPVGNAWGKLPRIVRDLAMETGKKLDLQMIGAETELDRQVLELIKDPLTHMVRNSADHGVEMPEERIRAGKPETGTVTLRAFHEGGHIIIEVSDDGRGLNTRKIRRKAADLGLVSEAELESMSDAQVQQLIFRPGFSTAEKVTNVSGRGVGMDVVKTNIEKIGGTVELKSTSGKGSVFTIKIPLTLAIVSALIVECGGERFAVPQLSVRELVRVSPSGEHSVEVINDSPVLRLRNSLLPLVSLHGLLKLEQSRKITDGDFFVVVTQVGAQNFGVVVDQVFDTEEIVVKPVARMLRKIPFYSGNTILGDGRVIMILDPNGIATAIGQATLASAAEEVEAVAHHSDQRASLIVFRAGDEERKAVPMALVARLESIDLASVERANDRHVVQYRGRLMPLVHLGSEPDWSSGGTRSVLVFSDQDRYAGVVVDEIIDIIEERLEVGLSSERQGILGTAVINGKATDLVDIAYHLTRAFSDWFGPAEDMSTSRHPEISRSRRLLLVDDSPFFLNLLTPQLAVMGFEVTTAESAEQALSLRDRGVRVDLIISDIEMPGMNGFEFAQAVLSDGRWGQVPMIALSSHVTKAYRERGKQAGFLDYVPKSRREELLRVLNQTLEGLGEAA